MFGQLTLPRLLLIQGVYCKSVQHIGQFKISTLNTQENIHTFIIIKIEEHNAIVFGGFPVILLNLSHIIRNSTIGKQDQNLCTRPPMRDTWGLP